jgi:hypothetical protein
MLTKSCIWSVKRYIVGSGGRIRNKGERKKHGLAKAIAFIRVFSPLLTCLFVKAARSFLLCAAL